MPDSAEGVRSTLPGTPERSPQLQGASSPQRSCVEWYFCGYDCEPVYLCLCGKLAVQTGPALHYLCF